MPHRLRAPLAVLLTATFLLTACSSGSDGPTPEPNGAPTTSAPPPTTPSAAGGYVALGDSFTAGPGIDPQRADAGFCQRSEQDWPSQLATTLGVDLTDLSCSGATTADLATTLASADLTTPPRLVTVSVGGNDDGLFLSLIRACATGTSTCTSFVDDQAPAILARVSTDVATLLGSVTSAAPDAEVALVGYPRLLPADGTCAAAVVSAADARTVARAETALDTALGDAADQAGVTYVSLREPSAGHDLCAGDQAWVNGAAGSTGDGIGFHPNRRGMAAVAAVVAAALR